MNALTSVQHKWYDIGLGLNVAKDKLDSIRGQYRDYGDCLREMLAQWLKSPPSRNWKDLFAVLKSSFIDEEALAMDLEAKVSRQQTTEPPPGTHVYYSIQYAGSFEFTH